MSILNRAALITLVGALVGCEAGADREARYQVARDKCSKLGAQAAFVQPGKINQPFAIAVVKKCLSDMGFPGEAERAFQ